MEQAVLVTVSVGPVTASGTYKGSIRLLYRGMGPGETLELPLEVKVTPKTNLEVAAHPNPLRVRVTRAVLPSWFGGKPSADVAAFSVRQKSDGAGRVRVIQTDPLDGSVEAMPVPNDALSIVRHTTDPPPPTPGRTQAENEYELAAEEWTTFRVAAAPPTSVPVPTRRPSFWPWRGTPARYSLWS